MKTAVYGGSFDPITRGHLDVIKEAVNLFDNVIIAIGTNSEKKPRFHVDVRMVMAKRAIRKMGLSFRAEVQDFGGLLSNFANQQNASTLIRGLRPTGDFEKEFQIATANLAIGGIGTIFIPTQQQYAFISSSLVDEVWKNKGNIQQLVHQSTEDLVKKFSYMSSIKPPKKELLDLTGIKQRYDNRTYHNWDHIQGMLKVMYEHRTQIIDDVLMYVAIVFHDYVYNTINPDGVTNESLSADAAEEAMKEVGFYDVEIKSVRELIMATRHPNPDALTYDEAMIHDLDLLGFLATPEEIKKTNIAIRKEFAEFTNAQYKKGRIEFLKKMLSQDHIFKHKAFDSSTNETVARTNIKNIIKELRAS
jgi:pantetheine-phosphate adenylyltransferase